MRMKLSLIRKYIPVFQGIGVIYVILIFIISISLKNGMIINIFLGIPMILCLIFYLVQNWRNKNKIKFKSKRPAERFERRSRTNRKLKINVSNWYYRAKHKILESKVSFQDKRIEKKRREQKNLLSKIERIMKTSSKIRLDMMREILQLNSSTYNSKILDWALDFGFKIDGDYIIIEGADVNAFISDLDRQFEHWKTKEKVDLGKK